MYFFATLYKKIGLAKIGFVLFVNEILHLILHIFVYLMNDESGHINAQFH